MPENRIALNVSLDPKLADMLDNMVAQDAKNTGIEMDRSKTVKRLIRQEFLRRQNDDQVRSDFFNIEKATQ